MAHPVCGADHRCPVYVYVRRGDDHDALRRVRQRSGLYHGDRAEYADVLHGDILRCGKAHSRSVWGSDRETESGGVSHIRHEGCAAVRDDPGGGNALPVGRAVGHTDRTRGIHDIQQRKRVCKDHIRIGEVDRHGRYCN